MNAEQFAYWLNGFVELNPNAMLTVTQWQIVKDHLALVHKKETPPRIKPLSEVLEEYRHKSPFQDLVPPGTTPTLIC